MCNIRNIHLEWLDSFLPPDVSTWTAQQWGDSLGYQMERVTQVVDLYHSLTFCRPPPRETRTVSWVGIAVVYRTALPLLASLKNTTV